MSLVQTHSLSDWLPADQGPWHLDFELWPQAQAQRWRAVLAVGAEGRKMLLAERELDAHAAAKRRGATAGAGALAALRAARR